MGGISSWGDTTRDALPDRFAGTCQIRLSGDLARAQRLIPLARSLLGGVRHRAALSGIDCGWSQWDGPETTILVSTSSGSNLISISVGRTTPVYVSYPGGSSGFVFYPKTDTDRNGIYLVGQPCFTYPLFLDSTPLPSAFSKLSHTLIVDERRVELKANPAVLAQAGNQFFFYGERDVYSWWHSPCGDGALLGTAEFGRPATWTYPTKSPYRPYCHNGLFHMVTEDLKEVYIPLLIYRNGAIQYEFPHDRYRIISGFWTGLVTFIKDGIEVTESRFVVAFSTAYPSIYTQVFCYREEAGALVALAPFNGTIILPVQGNPWLYSSGLNGFWPVRFSPDGFSMVTLACGATDATTYGSGRRDYIAVITATITHDESGIQIGSLTEQRTLGGTRTTTTYKSAYRSPPNRQDAVSDHRVWNGENVGGWSRFGSTETHDITDSWYSAAESGGAAVISDAQWPIAAAYTDQGILQLAYYSQSGEWSSSRVTSTMEYTSTEASFVESWAEYQSVAPFGSRGHYKLTYQANVSTTGTYRFVDGGTSEAIISLNGDTISQELSQISGNHIGTLSETRSSDWSQNDSPVVMNDSYLHVYSMKKDNSSRSVGFAVLHIDVKEAAFFWVSSAVSTTDSELTRSDWAGTNVLTATGSSPQTMSSSVALSIEVHGIVRGASVLEESFTQDVVVSSYTGEVSGILGMTPVYSSVTNPNVVQTTPLFCEVLPIFSATVPGSSPQDVLRFSFTYDNRYDRANGEPFPWAYSIRARAKVDVANQPPILWTFTKAHSTYGSLGDYIPTVDADGKPSDPVTDPTLTVHPIGLY